MNAVLVGLAAFTIVLVTESAIEVTVENLAEWNVHAIDNAFWSIEPNPNGDESARLANAALKSLPPLGEYDYLCQAPRK